MLKLKIFDKILLSIIAVGIILWLGGNVIRTAIAYNIFVPATELQFKPDMPDNLKIYNVNLFAMMAAYTDIGFLAALACSIILIINLRKNLKMNGWLFMSFMMFFIGALGQLFISYLDLRLIWACQYGFPYGFEDSGMKDYFLSRFRSFAPITPLSELTAFTSILLLIWKPLAKGKQDETE